MGSSRSGTSSRSDFTTDFRIQDRPNLGTKLPDHAFDFMDELGLEVAHVGPLSGGSNIGFGQKFIIEMNFV